MSKYKKYNENPFLNNALTPSEFFVERGKFEKLYPKEQGHPKPIDFWDEKSRYYGLMDPNMNFIVPDPAYLKQIRDDNNKSVFVFDFVANAFRDFEVYMNLTLRTKLVEDQQAFKKRVKVFAAWKDYEEIQSAVDEKNYDSFVNIVLKDKNRHAQVTNIEDFIELFFNFYIENILDSVPFTTEGMIQQGFIGPRSSGLCIEIGDEAASDGFSMFKKYINNVNFKTYALTAAKFGFLVDKNIPYRLVANLSSPKMLEYAKAGLNNYLSVLRSGESTESTKEWVGPSNNNSSLTTAKGTHIHEYKIDEYGNGFTSVVENPFNPGKDNHRHQIINFVVQEAQGWDYLNGQALGVQKHTHDLRVSATPVPFSIDRMYDAYFSEVAGLDVIRLRNLVFDYYNRYVSELPSALKQVPCGPRKTKQVSIQRFPIDKIDYKEEYQFLFFLKIYFMIRLKEMRVDIPEAQVVANIRKIENLYFTIDKSSALEYIQLYLKQYY